MDITNLDIHELYDLRFKINERIGVIESEATTALLLDIPYEGFTLKPGRNSRSVADEEEVITMCVNMGISRDFLVEPKFKGIPNMEKQIKVLSAEDQALIMEKVITTKSKPSVVYTGRPSE